MNEQSVLKILRGEFDEKLNHLQDLVRRDARFPDAPGKIKVAIGMRRAGKTFFLYQHILQLLSNGVRKSDILYINFEDDRLLPLNEKKLAKLVDAFYALYPENHERKCYFFFDEIQNVEKWPLIIRRLHDSKNIEIFLTGSSAKLLSKEISTSLRGRSLAIEIWPYSFSEYKRAKKISIDLSLFGNKNKDMLVQAFNEYLTTGGFPEVTFFNPDIRQKTLQEYLDITLYRDIIERHRIKNSAIVKYMILTIMHNSSRPFTLNKFYNDLKSQGYQPTKDALYDYADHIEDAYLAFSVPLYHRSIRKVRTNPKKLYGIDSGIIRALTLDYEHDLGRLFENIVYLDLRRLGAKVSYHLTSDRHEVDFLAQMPNGTKKMFQVVWDIQNEKTLEREERALREAAKELKIDGEMITLDSYLERGISI